jgi:isopenicillin N synthase-like dioxygenase
MKQRKSTFKRPRRQSKTRPFFQEKDRRGIIHYLRERNWARLISRSYSAQFIANCAAEWRTFFESDLKYNYAVKDGELAGYFPFMSEGSKDADHKDPKEFFHVYRDSPIPRGMTTATMDLFNRLAIGAMNCLAILHDSLPTEIKKTLDTPLDSMVRDSNRLVLRIAYYPLNNDTYAAYDLAAPHEDINLITLLPSTTELGLQIFEPLAGWKDVICGSNDLIVIAGDMLEECTRGYFQATHHRVVRKMVRPGVTARLSFSLFVNPSDDVRLSDRYTAGSYLMQCLKEIGLPGY